MVASGGFLLGCGVLLRTRWRWVFCCASGLVFLPLRWHPRYAFVLHASPFGVLAFAPASAL
jgi:hypothetical protein